MEMIIEVKKHIMDELDNRLNEQEVGYGTH